MFCNLKQAGVIGSTNFGGILHHSARVKKEKTLKTDLTWTSNLIGLGFDSHRGQANVLAHFGQTAIANILKTKTDVKSAKYYRFNIN
jgi:hypothetical protein